MPRTVTIVAHTVGPVGGMEKQLAELVSGLLGRGFEVTIISRTCELPGHPRLRWVRVRAPARPFVLAYPWFALLGSFLVWRRRKGLLHSTGAVVFNHCDVATAHICHHAIAEQGNLLRARQPSPSYRLNAFGAGVMSRIGERYCYRRSRTSLVAGVSPGLSAEIAGFFPHMSDRIRIVANGVDTRTFRPDANGRAEVRRSLDLPQDALCAIFVGSEWEGKGLRFALEAVARCPDWQLLVVGRGDKARYLDLAASLGAADRVRFIAPTPRIAPLYQAADAFLLPSAYETFSLVTYEAAASGLPLLATRVSGVEDVLHDGVNGWFVDRSAASLAARLGELTASEPLRRRMGIAAREGAHGFRWERMVDAYVALYDDLAMAEGARDAAVGLEAA